MRTAIQVLPAIVCIYLFPYAVAIEISRGANPIIRKNEIFHGLSAGVFVFDEGKGLIEDNDIYSNASSGVEVARSMVLSFFLYMLIFFLRGCSYCEEEQNTQRKRVLCILSLFSSICYSYYVTVVELVYMNQRVDFL